MVGDYSASWSSTSTNDADTTNIGPTNDADDLQGLGMIIDKYKKCSSIWWVLPAFKSGLLSASGPIIGIHKQEEGQLKS